ncbi:MAG: xanthan lyase, partial [Bacteroidales bacterium]|nr:xanthan lyase [Bacteroidales bacterium]
AGNTSDYPYIHGKAILKAGYTFFSCSNETFVCDTTFRNRAWSTDIICGKQVTTVTGSDARNKFTVFSPEMQTAIREYTGKGGNLLVSGAHIATDIWDQVYPVQIDSAFRAESKTFAREILGYRWVRNYAGKDGSVRYVKSSRIGSRKGKAFRFHNRINEECYCVETPDGIAPSSAKTGSTFLRYADTDISAGVCYEGKGYKTVCIGFPLETLKEEKNIDHLINTTLDFFNR